MDANYHHNYPTRSRAKSRGIHRGALVMLLIALLGMVGGITYTVNASIATTIARHVITSAIPSPSNNTAHARPKAAATPTVAKGYVQPLGYPLYSGNTQLPEIALTFDDGPHPYYTPQILAVLRQFGVKATFFDVGYLVQDYPALVQEEFNAGHTVANHSWSHPQLTRLSQAAVIAQLTRTSDIIQSVIGVRPTVFRPPYGSFNQIVIAQATSQHLTTVLWNDEAHDWVRPGASVIANRILHLARNGTIILLHDGGGDRAQTVAALPIIITSLLKRGFTFVTIQQLLHDLASPGRTAFSYSPTNHALATTLTLSSPVWKREFSA